MDNEPKFLVLTSELCDQVSGSELCDHTASNTLYNVVGNKMLRMFDFHPDT